MASRSNSRMKSKRACKSSNDKTTDKTEEDSDISILNKPLQTSINNLPKILKLFQSTTVEIRGYLENDCDILYECRICRNIFRSLSNFIQHKRTFCQEKYNFNTHCNWPRNDDEYLEIFHKHATKTTENNLDDRKNSKKNLNSVIEGLAQKKQFGFEIDNFSIEEFYKQNSDSFGLNSVKKLDLEEIQGSNSGVFQTLKQDNDESTGKSDNMKVEVMEMLHMTKEQTAVLGPDGKVVNLNTQIKTDLDDSTSNKLDMICKKCKITFSTRKTFLSHLKYKHENMRVLYPCLECSETFSTVWSVYRHLYNIHRKTLAEVRKMRPKIQQKAFRIEELENKTRKSETQSEVTRQQKIDEENQQWMESFETYNDIQMCGGCGRRFERKAALNSHSQTCQKRIAVKNSINLNKQKRNISTDDKVPDNKKVTSRSIGNKTDNSESEKRYFEAEKSNIAKKRKIGIQIRCDYSKASVEKNSPLKFTGDSSKRDSHSSNDSNLKTASPSNSEDIYETINLKENSNENGSLDCNDPEIVSIPSSNSTPTKQEEDPLLIKEVNSDSDSEISEIIENTIFESIPNSNDYEINEMQLTNIKDTTLKLIELINSNIPDDESTKPTIDDKMSQYINMKKLQCIPCNIKFSNISKLRHHMASHFNWVKFRCDICSFKAYDKLEVFDHIKLDHNIQDTDKIEAVILQIPDWETVELSSENFLDNIDTPTVSPKAENFIISDPKNSETSETNDDDNPSSTKLSKKPKIKTTKSRRRKCNITEINESQSDSNEPIENNISSVVLNENESIPESSSESKDNIKQMVYEVIFGGQHPFPSKTTNEEKKIPTTDVSSQIISRPIRNRVKPINKDFVYDLHEFKESAKTVLNSNNKSNLVIITTVSNKISESLEEINYNSLRTNKTENTNKKILEVMGDDDNIVNNLQKKSISNFGNQRQIGTDGNTIKIVDPKSFLEDVGGESDDDVYIVENEELVAVK